ncbi:pyridoxine 5-phosphate synthase [Luteibacter sp. Sphag1AF]|uniref:pyridoxine 5'-phosphate synthase n=1 Tax=Luteibacter sp. Sphag1AF TaxID=2587031 RepID=UPI00160852B0|nr:pyridoxine 5'-phosphate synthase [Luteibacter sp. Sphag1AF]MBB3226618.1 pyridoxine 5-phosphate synthase [Luteibacter sp. Sphag1AF]
MTVLSVNLNKIAVLRNSRGGHEPDIATAANTCIDAGCGGLTVHPRPDMRHVRPDDVRTLAGLLRGRVEYNIEGNPFAPARGAYPGLIELAREVRPTQVTLVPDGDGQLTSDHGFDLTTDLPKLTPIVAAFREMGCRVSVFVDAGGQGFEEAVAIGIQRIELYTGPYAEAFAKGDARSELASFAETAQRAQRAGLAVNAGHDLSQANLGTFKSAIPGLAEVSIGHALISEALYQGMANTVRAYLGILA